MERYVDRLLREMDMHAANPWVQRQSYNSVYIGGGTPTILQAEWLERILLAVRAKFPLTPDCEICVEVRPGNEAEPEKLNRMAAAGVSRVSMGAQTLNPEVLKKNGRMHSVDKFYEIYGRVRDAGIHFVNVDLMSGLPHDTMETWVETVRRATELAPENVTCYKTHTYRGSELERMTEGLVSAEEELDMFQMLADSLRQRGYAHYDISYTFAKSPRYAHQHRLQINRANQYLAMGVSGNGYMNRSVYQNMASIEEYEEAVDNGRLPIKRAFQMDRETMIKRALIHGVRRGVIERQHFALKFGRDPWDLIQERYSALAGDELVEVDDNEVRLVDEALPFADHIARRYLLDGREQKMERLLANHKNLHVLPSESMNVLSSRNPRLVVDLRDPRR